MSETEKTCYMDWGEVDTHICSRCGYETYEAERGGYCRHCGARITSVAGEDGPFGRTASIWLFKPSGTYYTTDSWRVPGGAVSPADMRRSKDARTIDGGLVVVAPKGEIGADENWGFPQILNLEED